MAYRLRSAIAFGFAAIVTCVAAGVAAGDATRDDNRDAMGSRTPQLFTAVATAARALGRYYEVANDGASESFVSRALASGVRAGRSERCRLPDGRPSMRPSVLANPLLPASSIRQRTTLFATIAAYEIARAARANGADRSFVGDADRTLAERLATLEVAADTHAQGDLFIEDLAHALRQAIPRDGSPNGVDPASRTDAAESIVGKLLDILATDVARQRVDTVDAAALAYRGWALDAEALRKARSRVRVAVEPPFCSEPAIYARGATLPTAQLIAGMPPGRMRSRAERARDRYAAVRSAHPERVVDALRSLDRMLARASASSGATDTNVDPTNPIVRFGDEVRVFAEAMRGVR